MAEQEKQNETPGSTKKYSHKELKEILQSYMEPCLVVRNRRDFGKIIQLPDGETILGREMPGIVDIGGSTDGISRRHAKFTVSESAVIVEDLESNNGVFIGSRKIDRAVLQGGETILLGTVILQFQYLEPAEIDAYRSLSIDPLTGALNRKQYSSQAERKFEEWSDVSLVMIDIDNLKNINDQFGRSAGDYSIASFGAIVRSLLKDRFSDSLFFRYSGDRFLVLFHDSAHSKVSRFEGELLFRITKLHFDSNGTELPLSISMGACSTSEFQGAMLSELIKMAESKLNQQKIPTE